MLFNLFSNQVRFTLPKVRVLARALDKMKAVSDHVTVIAAPLTRSVTIAVQNEVCVVMTLMQNVQDNYFAPLPAK